ncbi:MULTISPECIES: M20 family metallopeptidase [Prauserella salsuginis group]|uniref:Acetylornithine deacetylase/succinyl-diaminopimelate desuccinylase-like protein n=2 Tax=Prauserella salsuginis group TaxID=2893672 RepID=A0A839Y0V8_9PSEU|nr:MULTISPECIES: M20 family metallopeptidase [Prauserella salsuginis group]MBB3666323.1 acetylornithine deacetylase/succinyl-diaminopimelate desuccinylase-like protein [Prauserella sediminis]MCR3722279.1 Acetylornithine deacetylase/Succinyl-diaminopimelate desuccinylase [Prauserella flava]MCR3736277.1 Acetylornithine deacetylase/Succinyl-diaminopimelate desuccinylase [Prauserella salsuginis]
MLSEKIRRNAESYVDSGGFRDELARLVSYPTESATAEGRVAIKAYLDEVLTPALTELGCTVTEHANPDPAGGPFLVGTRVESADRPTVLCYGHADVVEGLGQQWSDGRDPWRLTVDGDRWYGRGAADNKGQHLVNLAALRLLLAEHGELGFNLTMLFETGEEIGSPGLAEFAAAHRELLAADLFLASDGPRLDAATPTLFLGSRGGLGIELDVDLRTDSYHSGNWGGLLRNPATTLAGAVSSLVDGHGRIRVPELLPPELPDEIREALADVRVAASPGDPVPDDGWGEPGLTPAERLYGWNTLEVLALGAADVDRPVNAIPGRAKAVLQLRYVAGTDVDRAGELIASHLAEHGYPTVDVSITGRFAASRTDVDGPWPRWARALLEEATGGNVAVLPNIGGSLPNFVFTDVLGMPALWLPHSYPGCLQHAPDEHLLAPIAREGIVLAATLFDAIGHPTTDHPLPTLGREDAR